MRTQREILPTKHENKVKTNLRKTLRTEQENKNRNQSEENSSNRTKRENENRGGSQSENPNGNPLNSSLSPSREISLKEREPPSTEKEIEGGQVPIKETPL